MPYEGANAHKINQQRSALTYRSGAYIGGTAPVVLHPSLPGKSLSPVSHQDHQHSHQSTVGYTHFYSACAQALFSYSLKNNHEVTARDEGPLLLGLPLLLTGSLALLLLLAMYRQVGLHRRICRQLRRFLAVLALDPAMVPWTDAQAGKPFCWHRSWLLTSVAHEGRSIALPV